MATNRSGRPSGGSGQLRYPALALFAWALITLGAVLTRPSPVVIIGQGAILLGGILFRIARGGRRQRPIDIFLDNVFGISPRAGSSGSPRSASSLPGPRSVRGSRSAWTLRREGGRAIPVAATGLDLGRMVEPPGRMEGDLRCSGVHARVEPRGDALVLSDLGSTNGTYVDGVRIQSATLVRPGQQIRIGRTHLTVERTLSAPSTYSVSGSFRQGRPCA